MNPREQRAAPHRGSNTDAHRIDMSREARIMVLAGVILALLTPFGCVSFEDLEETGALSPTATRCGDCHVEIFAEWKASPHALAFLSTQFQARTDGGSMEACLPCHAPGTLNATADRPATFRTDHMEEGVNCRACHLVPEDHGNGESTLTLAGPLESEALVQPHAVNGIESWFRDSALCGRCHQDTYAEWQASPVASTPSCQECHMPEVRRKVTQATGMISRALVAFEEEHTLRAHTFDIDSALGESAKFITGDFIEIESSHQDGILELRLTNNLPHALPTGSFGMHALTLTVHAGDMEIFKKRLTAKRQGALASGGELIVEFPWPRGEKRVILDIHSTREKGIHGRRAVLIASHTIERPDSHLPPDEPIDRIELAREGE